MITLMTAIWWPQAVFAQTPPVSLASCTDLESYLDELMRTEMESAELPGVMVAVVANGEIVLTKGYGVADMATRTPVSPDTSLFQMGSLSKPFTWTAVMQLVERGELDLHADISNYVGDRIPIDASFDQPITLAHLMTHTAGFEDRILGIYTRNAADLTDLEQFLAANAPARVRPPGQFTAYSNYGTALAAYIVERVAGMPFEAYVAQNIFRPLAMTHATFRQPLPADMPGVPAVGYGYEGDALAAQEPVYTRQLGAGGLISNAGDMAHFMLAYLQNGRYADNQILQPETVDQMFRQPFSHHSQVAGVAGGFWQTSIDGHRVWYHTGDTLSFSSLLALLPEANVGVFVAYNRVAAAPRINILQGIVDHCLSGVDSKMNGTAPVVVVEENGRFAGQYRTLRHDHTTPAKLTVFGWVTTVEAFGDGQLLVDGRRFEPIGPQLFRQVNGPERVAFRTDAGGNATHLFFDSQPTMAYARVNWYDAPAVHVAALAASLLLFAASLMYWALIAQRRRSSFRQPASVRWLAAAMSLLALMVAGGAAMAMMSAADLVFGMPQSLAAAVALAPIFAFLAGGTAVLTLVAWIRRDWSRGQRLHFAFLSLAGVVLVWFLSYWNLLLPG